ncbi:hypothetical protein RFM41_10140 [Mesorhizobium sp. VK25A]|uniref:Uncharacterized protein n=1 Tax=Mesorhizobium vachelliae TaxID=3072309 RepID=A0ABU4ZXI5_9HYPH|nr:MULTISPECIES: hypothetical protein [unclassified Mesorhizobium]MDX8529702.1 hypothetical protein [Mesorhizobium sp. VK25D]MDX8544100.1 hypothetical protein [Mesorhizobium sp. VK25A]
MALDILTHDITADEPAGLTNDHADPSVAPDSANATPQCHPDHDAPGVLTSPQVALRTRLGAGHGKRVEAHHRDRGPFTWMGSAIIRNQDCETGTPRRIRR